MRSSKSRSRSKQNRPRSLGNIVNRVFDSSGPEGKVRGTPQQIIDKYLVLARDAQLGNDRVASENFLQHAEHYIRMLAEAQREMARDQEARQQQGGQNGHGGSGDQDSNANSGGNGGNGGGGSHGNGGHNSNSGNANNGGGNGGRRDRGDRGERYGDQRPGGEVIDFDEGRGDSGLVETPEQRQESEAAQPAPATQPAPAAPQPSRRKPAAEKPAAESAPGDAPAEGEASRPRRRPRKPRAAEGGSEGASTEGGESRTPAAE
jgi:hypothetical protein